MYFYDGTECARYLAKTQTECEIALYNNWWNEQIQQYGQAIDYSVYNFSLSAQDATYGEDTPAVYATPQSIIAVVDLSQSQLFARWALMSDDSTTILIHITAFRDTFGDNAEPKSGDVFKLTEFGSDRPSGREGKMFQVTERLDEEVSQINQLMGHFVWLIKAKRYEYSFEPGLSAEAVSDQVYDNTFFGRLSGGDNPPTALKAYPGTSADDYQKTLFDYASAGNESDVYGGYT